MEGRLPQALYALPLEIAPSAANSTHEPLSGAMHVSLAAAHAGPATTSGRPQARQPPPTNGLRNRLLPCTAAARAGAAAAAGGGGWRQKQWLTISSKTRLREQR